MLTRFVLDTEDGDRPSRRDPADANVFLAKLRNNLT